MNRWEGGGAGRVAALAVAMLLATTMSPRAVLADDGTGGTHVLVEATVGASLPLGAEGDGVGFSTGAMLGFGGKLPGSLLRLYALLGYTYADFAVAGEDGAGAAVSLDRAMSELSVGGRALVPIFVPHLRIFVDGLVGLSWLAGEVAGKSGVELERVEHTPRLSARVGSGVQFRPVMWLSAGVRLDLGFLLDRTDLSDDEILGRLDLLGSVTFHF